MIINGLKLSPFFLAIMIFMFCQTNTVQAINKSQQKKEIKSKKNFFHKVKEKALTKVLSKGGFFRKPADLSKKELLYMWLGCWLAAILIYGAVYLFLREATGNLLVATLALILTSVGLAIIGSFYLLLYLMRLINL